MTAMLKINYGLLINHKRVYRLIKEHNLLSRKYNLRAGKYDASKDPQDKKVKNRFHQNFITNRHPGHTYLLLRDGNEHQYF